MNAGSYEVTANFAGSADYTVAQSRIVDFSIAQANATIDGVFPYNVVYDGQPHTASGAVWGVNGIGLSLDLSATTHTNVGTYIDTWTFTDTTGNYNNASGTVVDAIAKANATVNLTFYSVTYDGTFNTATKSVSGIGGMSLSGLNLGGTVHTNAGDLHRFVDLDRYHRQYNSASGTVVDTIAKAVASITVTPYSVTYDSNAHTATVSATGVGSDGALTGLNLTGTTHTNAGTYAATPGP